MKTLTMPPHPAPHNFPHLKGQSTEEMGTSRIFLQFGIVLVNLGEIYEASAGHYV